MNPQEKVRRAFDNIYDRHPYFAGIVASWRLSYTNVIPTAATNGPKLYINPDFIETLNISETTDLMLHEAGHVFLGHHLRFSNVKDPQEWNVAADLGLNDYLIPHYDHTGKIFTEGCFPGRVPFSELPQGKDAEWYFEKVRQSRPKMPKPQQGGGQGQQQGSQQSQGQSGQGQGNGQPQPGSGSGGQQGKSQNDSKGNGAKGEDEGKDEPNPTPQSRSDLPKLMGEILPYPLAENEELEDAMREWEQKIAQSVQDAINIGNCPGWIRELAEELYGHKSKLDWKLLLRRFLTKNVPFGGTSFERLNRRQAYRAQQILIPSNRSRQASNGVILVDTSGSMDTSQMDQALSEIEKILSTYPKCQVTMYMCDTRLIEESKRVFRRADFPLRIPQEWMGRGGTELGPAVAEIGKLARRNGWKWFVVLSDMYWAAQNCPNPHIATMFVWVDRAGATEPYARPTFGQLIGPIETSA